MDEISERDMSKSQQSAPPAREPAIAPARRKAESAADSGANNMILDRLLAMAHGYRSAGNLQQAMEMYWTLLNDYPETAQARRAGASLFEMAQEYERAGSMHMARSIYTRLI